MQHELFTRAKQNSQEDRDYGLGQEEDQQEEEDLDGDGADHHHHHHHYAETEEEKQSGARFLSYLTGEEGEEGNLSPMQPHDVVQFILRQPDHRLLHFL
jgi:hypothetical protein